jgi:chromosomal replication initiator protein
MEGFRIRHRLRTNFARKEGGCSLFRMMDVVVFSPPAGGEIRTSRIEAIQQHVARAFGLQVEELNQRSTTRAVTLPRQLAIYLAKQLTDASLVEIGNHFGGKHHSTVMHSVAKIDQLRRKDPAVNLAVDMLMKTLKRY